MVVYKSLWPHRDAEKDGFLEELREIRAACIGPWAIAGDFNMIYCSGGKNNSNVNRVFDGSLQVLCK